MERKFRSVHSRGIALGHEHLVRLKRTRLAILPLGNVEDNGMRVQLRRSIAVHWPRGVMLEGRRDEFAGCLRRMHIADARLCIVLKFLEGYTNTLAMSFPY